MKIMPADREYSCQGGTNMSITISVLLENRPNPNAKNLLRAKAGLSLLIQDENDSNSV
jgi:hypothetical protein